MGVEKKKHIKKTKKNKSADEKWMSGRGPEDNVWNEYKDKKEKGQKLTESSKTQGLLATRDSKDIS